MKTFTTRLLDLLQRYEEQAFVGSAPDPAELCADEPELLPAFREALGHLDEFRRRYEEGTDRDTQPALGPPGGVRGLVVPGFVLGAELGRGGMGVVYAAEQTALRRKVAVKMILAAHLAGAASLERFRREAEAVARLRHPGIVQVFEVGTWTAPDGSTGPFMALEFLDGGSLAHKLAGQPQPPREAATLVRALAEAMQHAHEQGVVHRDLKPGNVLLASDGTPKITDFGLARLLDEDGGHTRTGAALGTPPYMAPEQIAGDRRAFGPGIDVWALGAVLYECLTGRPPFRGTTTGETFALVREQEPVAPRRLNPRIPRDLETICLKCLQKEPARRYRSAQDLADDLGRFLDGRPIHARPVGWGERVGKWAARNPLLAVLILATVLGPSVGLAFGLAALQRAEAEKGRKEAALRERNQAYDDLQAESRRREAANRERERHYRTAIYTRDLDRAAVFLRGGDLRSAHAGLLALPADLRGWEWDHLVGQCRRREGRLAELPAEALAVAFRPDGKALLVGCKDRTARLFDLAAGGAPRSVAAHGDEVVGVAFGPDGRWFATAGDRTVKVWDADTLQLRRTLDAGLPVSALAVGGDGRLAAGCRLGQIRVWDEAGREVAALAGRGWVQGLAFAPDGKQLAVGGVGFGHTLQVWDLAEKKARPFGERDGGPAFRVAFSPDGKTLAAGWTDGRATLHDAGTGRVRHTLHRPGSWVRGLAFHPEGRELLVASDTLRYYDPESGALRDEVRPVSPAPVQHAAWSPDGSRVAVVDSSRGLSLPARAVPPESWSRPGLWTIPGSVAFDPAGRCLAVPRGDGTILLLEAGTGRELGALPSPAPAWGLAFHPTADRLVAAGNDGSVRVWDPAAREEVRSFAGHAGIVRTVAVSPDGRLVASAGLDQTIRLWDWNDGTERAVLRGHADAVVAVAFSPDGRRLASAGFDGTVRLWDIASGSAEAAWAAHGAQAWCVAFTPDGTGLASGGADERAVLWDLETKQPRFELRGGRGTVVSLAFTPDGRRLLTGSGSKEGGVKIWDTATGQEVHALDGVGGGVSTVRCRPGGQSLATVTSDGRLQVWDSP